MPTPAIVASTRYTDKAVTKCYWIPTIAATSLVPTRVEMNAGTDLSPQLADWSGWTLSANQIETPDLATSFTSKIPGSLTSEDSSLTLYASKNGVDARSLMPRGQAGNLMFCDGGDITANKADVFPVTVTSVGKIRSLGGEEAAKLLIGYSITAQPAENVTIPAT